VRVRTLLVPPLLQPTLPELPAGVLTVTFAVPGPEIKSVGSVTCTDSLLRTVVASVVSLMITTEDATNSLPVTVRTKPPCAWASVMVVDDRELMAGTGRELPHNGLSALQAVRTSMASASACRRHGAGIP